MSKQPSHSNRRAIRPAAWALAAALAAAVPSQAAKFKVLNFWGVGGFAHGSRTAANNLLDSLAKVMDIEVVKADQATAFTAANLAQFQVVFMNNTTEPGKIMNVDQRAALLDFMKKKGFVGVHGAGDTKGTWPDYTAYLGGELSSHGGGIATLNVECASKEHPILAGLPAQIKFDEEWYAYKTNPRNSAGVSVLFTLDEASCPGCTKMPGGDHPIAWTKVDPAGGRTFYYAMGHGNSIFQRNAFCQNMLKQALLWAGGEGNQTYPAATGCGPVGTKSAGPAFGKGLEIKAGRGALVIDVAADGEHTVQINSLDGRRIARRSGTGNVSHAVGSLKSGTMYSVVVNTFRVRHSRLVVVP